jgi:hypothetical protein
MFSSALPEDRESRWALLDRVLSRWFHPSPELGGVAEGEVARCEARLGFRLPEALREWQLRCGARDDVWCLQDNFLKPADLRMGRDVLVFCRENQNVVQWGIERTSLNLPDPPVLVSDLSDPKAWFEESDTTSRFALQFAALNAKWSDLPRFRANFDLSDDVAAAFEDSLPRLPFPDLHFPPFPTRILGNEDLVVELDSNAWVWVAALTSEAFATARAIVQDAGGEFVETPAD